MNEELKGKIKKVLWKMCNITVLIFIIATSVCLAYFSEKYYQTKTLSFGLNDMKLFTCLIFMILWIFCFTIFLMVELYKKDKIIISQNEIIMKKNDTIESLLNKVIQQNTNIENKANNIEEKTDSLQEAIDYDIERNEEQYIQLIKSNRNTQELILLDDDRSDNIAK